MLFPYVQSRRVRLRPATAENGREAYELLLGLGLESLPSLDSFVSINDPNVPGARFMIERRDTGETVGFSTLHEYSIAGHIQASVYTDPEKAKGVGADAALFTINYAFAMWNLRKVYVQTTDASLPDFGTLLDDLEKEAVLPGHLFFRGQHWDLHIYAIYRQDWEEFATHFLKDVLV